jgi:branched-chain amino acid transport system substrate-binding protein
MRRQWLSVGAILTGIALVAGACGGLGPGAGDAPAGTTVKIVSSLPMTGPSLTQTQTIVNAIEMALAEVNNKVGNVTIEYEKLDDATPAKQSWDGAKEAENARKAIADTKVVAYIGTFNSGAAQVSIPLLCAANLAMISPANTYPGLTKKAGAAQGEPEKFYPGGCKRNYTRVVPADDLQGAVAAAWMKELGGKKVFITHDNELYGKGLADVFREAAKKQGITEAGYEAAPKADNFRALANKIKDSGADFVYYGGITDNNPAVLVRDLKSAAPSIKFMGPDGIAESEFLKGAAAAGEGAYITFGGIPPSEYKGKSKDWSDAYQKKFNSKPEVYAIYGYEAAKVVLEAIKKSGAKATDRATVRDNIFGTKDFDGVLGTKWSFDAGGDTSITTMAGMIVKSGDFSFVKLLESK